MIDLATIRAARAKLDAVSPPSDWPSWWIEALEIKSDLFAYGRAIRLNGRRVEPWRWPEVTADAAPRGWYDANEFLEEVSADARERIEAARSRSHSLLHSVLWQDVQENRR